MNIVLRRVLLHHTIVRLLESLNENDKFIHPLKLIISDALDGLGSQKIYNQHMDVQVLKQKVTSCLPLHYCH